MPNPKREFMWSRFRNVSCLLLLIAAGMAGFGAIGPSRAISQRVGNPLNVVNKIAPWVIAQTANGQQAEFFVVLADQADLSAAGTLRTKAEKSRFVHDALWPKSQTTQGPFFDGCGSGVEHRLFIS
jgi:hypothetical protein